MAKKQTTTKRNRPACDQCGKPSVVALQDFALCVDCYHRLQEANYMAEKIVDAQFTRQMHMFNLNADQIAAAVPFPETVARFRIPAPIYHHQGDLALQNFNVSNSIVG